MTRSEAEKASSSDPEHFYRVLIELKDGSIINIFYRRGTLCAIIVLQPGGLEARVSKAKPESVLASITQESISIIRIYRVECTSDMEALFERCPAEQPQVGEKPPMPREEPQETRKEKEKKRRRF